MDVWREGDSERDVCGGELGETRVEAGVWRGAGTFMTKNIDIADSCHVQGVASVSASFHPLCVGEMAHLKLRSAECMAWRLGRHSLLYSLLVKCQILSCRLSVKLELEASQCWKASFIASY